MDLALVLGLRPRSWYDWIDAEGISFSHSSIHALSFLALIARCACDMVYVSWVWRQLCVFFLASVMAILRFSPFLASFLPYRRTF